MSSLAALRVRLRSLFRRSTVERELDEELRDHLERETERLVAGGMDPGDAREAARRRFGNVEYLKEESRDARGVRVLENALRDIGAGLRLTRKQPGFAAVVVLSLALGLGATTAVFNVTYNVLFATLAVPHPERLTSLRRTHGGDTNDRFSWNELRALRETPGIGVLSAVRTASQIPLGVGPVREYVNMHFVDGAFFSMLGLRPLHGRFISPDDDTARATVVVLAEWMAARLFPGDSSVLGRTVNIRGVPFSVIGVAPRAYRGLEYPGQFTAAIPLSTVPLLAGVGDRPDDRGLPLALVPRSDAPAYKIAGRLAVDRRAAAAALGVVFARCCAVGPAAGDRLQLIDIRRGIPGGKDDFRDQVGMVLEILLAGMGLVLVVVCGNIAGLLLVRGASRQREIAVRLSLGASRGRILRQLVWESLPLAVVGGLLGLFVALWATAGLIHSIPEWGAYLDALRFRAAPPVFLFTGSVTLLCGFAFALYPALRATRGNLAPTLRLDARVSRDRGQGAAARGIVVAQVALTVVLVTAASLLAVTLRNLARVDGGFATEHVLLLSLDARGTSYEVQGVAPLGAPILERLRALPGVRTAALASMMPLFGGSIGSVELDVPGIAEQAGRRPSVRFDAVAPGYFATLGIPLQSGRDFTTADAARSEPVVIVSAAFARHYFGGRETLGRSFAATLRGDSLTAVRIVGIAADAKYENLRSEPEALIYVPLTQTSENWSSLQIGLRVAGEATDAAPAVARAVEAAAPSLRIRRVSDVRTLLATATAMERLAARLAGFASGMALALSMMGLYGVVAYGVARRTRELGIRVALGAHAPAIVWLVVRDLVLCVGVGAAIGLPLAFATGGAIRSQLFGVTAHDPRVAGLAVLLLVVVVLLAGALPARRAVRIDPRIALSAE